MKNKLVGILVIFTLVVAASAFAQSPTFIGSAKCKICHNTEKQGQMYPIWEKSSHSKSFAALSSSGAAANATALGVKDPTTDAKCLKCHAPLAGDLKAEGVGCEVCHGAGSAYKSLNVMKVKDDAVKAGLVLYANADAIKAKCLTCHLDAHGKTFDLATQWAKIKHAIPAK
jgi:hypothetical protein